MYTQGENVATGNVGSSNIMPERKGGKERKKKKGREKQGVPVMRK